jgi:hypothetical protein
MSSQRPHLVTAEFIVHRYAARALDPKLVRQAWFDFTIALNLPSDEWFHYAVDEVEIAAFELFLNRTVPAEDPAVHDLRENAIIAAVSDAFDHAGDTPADVRTEMRIGPSSVGCALDIARAVEQWVALRINASAISFFTDHVMVDGVHITYPYDVADAIQAAAQGVVVKPVPSPF